MKITKGTANVNADIGVKDPEGVLMKAQLTSTGINTRGANGKRICICTHESSHAWNL
jgi:hypothetical protein